MLIKFFTKKNLLIVFSAFLIMALFVGCPASGGTTTDTPALTGDGDNPTIWAGTKLTSTEEFEAFNNAVTVDANQNVICAGLIRNPEYFVSDAKLDGEQLNGINNFFVVKYNSNGKKLWTRALGMGNGYATATGVAVDATGDIYVTGYTRWTSSVSGVYINYTGVGLDGQKTLNGTIGSDVNNLFVTKFNVNGVKQWTRIQGTVSQATDYHTYAYGIATDTYGNVYVSGKTTDQMAMSPYISTTSTGYGDAFVGTANDVTTNLFVSKFDTRGICKFTALLGQTGSTNTQTVGNSIAVSSSGEQILVTGYTTASVFAALSGTQDLLITAYDDSLAIPAFFGTQVGGSPVGASTIEGKGIDINRSTLNPSNDVYKFSVVGHSNGGVGNIGAKKGTGVSAEGIDAFLGLYTYTVSGHVFSVPSSNSQILGAQGSSYNETHATGVKVDALGNSYISGYTNVSLNGITLHGFVDAIIYMIPETGTGGYSDQLGNYGEYVYANAIGMDASNNLYIAGSTTGNLDGKVKIGGVDACITKYTITASGTVHKW